jgi:hypothetical protein
MPAHLAGSFLASKTARTACLNALFASQKDVEDVDTNMLRQRQHLGHDNKVNPSPTRADGTTKDIQTIIGAFGNWLRGRDRHRRATGPLRSLRKLAQQGGNSADRPSKTIATIWLTKPHRRSIPRPVATEAL